MKIVIFCVFLIALLQGITASRELTEDGRTLKAGPKKLFQGMTFSPQIKKVPGDTSPYPFTCMNAEYTNKALNVILPYTNRIRLYSSICYEAQVTILVRSANEGFEVFAGLFGTSNQTAFTQELGMLNMAY